MAQHCSSQQGESNRRMAALGSHLCPWPLVWRSLPPPTLNHVHRRQHVCPFVWAFCRDNEDPTAAIKGQNPSPVFRFCLQPCTSSCLLLEILLWSSNPQQTAWKMFQNSLFASFNKLDMFLPIKRLHRIHVYSGVLIVTVNMLPWRKAVNKRTLN